MTTRTVTVVLGLAGSMIIWGSSLVAAQKPPAGAMRSLVVSAEPGATVFIDSVRYGRTDEGGKLRIKSVTAGPHTLRVRADGFAERSQPLGAAPDVRVVLTKTTDEAELAFQEAERLTGVDRERAADAYRKAIKLKPSYLAAHLGLARVLLDAGDVDEAAAAIASARKVSPANAEASAIMGRINKENGEEEKAIVSYKRALTEGKGVQPEALAGLGLLYKEKAETAGGRGEFANEDANYVEAAKYLRSSLKQLGSAPDAMVMYQLLGLIYERQKKPADAIAVYEEFLRLFPDSAEASAVQSFIVQLKKDHPE